MQEERTGIGAGAVQGVLCTKVNQNYNLKHALTIDRYQKPLDYFDINMMNTMDEETRAGAYTQWVLFQNSLGSKR